MARPARLFLTIALLCGSSPLVAGKGAAGLNLINNTGQTIFNLYIRRTGTQSWQPLVASPPKPTKGGKTSAAFADPDCAFDLKVTLEDKSEPIWPGVNLCEEQSLTLNRNETGVTWVDYD